MAMPGTMPVRQRLFAEVLAGARLANGMAERGGPHAQDLKTKLIQAGAGLRQRATVSGANHGQL